MVTNILSYKAHTLLFSAALLLPTLSCKGDDEPSAPPAGSHGGAPGAGASAGGSTGGSTTTDSESGDTGLPGGTLEGSGDEGLDSGSGGPICEQHYKFSCIGYRIGLYKHSISGTTTWNPLGSGATAQCFPSSDIQICAPYTGEIDMTDDKDPLTEEILMRCSDLCQLTAIDTSVIPDFLPAIDGGTWQRIDSQCFFEAAEGSGYTPPEYGGFEHACSDLVSTPDPIAGIGECDGDPGDATECPIGSDCADWRPVRSVYSQGADAVVDVEFVNDIDIGKLYACDGASFVYSSDGSGYSYIDGVTSDDMLYRLGLRDGMHDFEVRNASKPTWYPLNTYGEILAAYSALAGTTEFELRFYRDAARTKKTVQSIEVKQCGSSCDRSDL